MKNNDTPFQDFDLTSDREIIESCLSDLQDLKENLKKKYLTKDQIKEVEAEELRETKRRIWNEDPELEKEPMPEKTEGERETEEIIERRGKEYMEVLGEENIDLDAARDELQKEFEKEDQVERKTETETEKRGNRKNRMKHLKELKKKSKTTCLNEKRQY